MWSTQWKLSQSRLLVVHSLHSGIHFLCSPSETIHFYSMQYLPHEMRIKICLSLDFNSLSLNCQIGCSDFWLFLFQLSLETWEWKFQIDNCKIKFESKTHQTSFITPNGANKFQKDTKDKTEKTEGKLRQTVVLIFKRCTRKFFWLAAA